MFENSGDMYDFILDIIEEIVTTKPLIAQLIDWTSQALTALKHARTSCGKIEAYLLPAHKARPKLSEYPIRVGGDDEAWLYRESRRSVWAAAPAALAWLKSA